MNVIILKGRLARDPELKDVNGKNGLTSVCSFDLAVDNPFSEGTSFFRCSLWGKSGQALHKYCTKGSEIAVEGSMISEKYQDQSGENRTAWKVKANQFHFCGKKSDNPGGGNAAVPEGFQEIDEDDIPF